MKVFYIPEGEVDESRRANEVRSLEIVDFIKPEKILTVPALSKKDINDFD